MKFPILVRQVRGQSMLPTIKPGQLLIATQKFKIKKGSIVIVKVNGREIVKRITNIEGSRIYVLGENPKHSTDSRSLGWINVSKVTGKVIWPQFN